MTPRFQKGLKILTLSQKSVLRGGLYRPSTNSPTTLPLLPSVQTLPLLPYVERRMLKTC